MIQKLGFSPTEKSVFDSLIFLKIGMNVSTIARTSKLPRSTVLYTLRKFEGRKLVRRTIQGKRTYWVLRKL